MRRAAKTDDNQAMIVAAFRGAGATVTDTSAVGQGFPDLVVGYKKKNLLVEVKDGSKPPSARKLTPAQVKFHGEWRGTVHIVETVEQALELLARVRKGEL